jgi:hypothetical protein
MSICQRLFLGPGILTSMALSIYFALMYFKISIQNNSQTGKIDDYYRLVESYRNEYDSFCHHTILSAGFLDGLSTGQLNLIQNPYHQQSGLSWIGIGDNPVISVRGNRLQHGKDHQRPSVSCSNMKNYSVEAGTTTVIITDKREQKIALCRVKSDRNTDYYLNVKSHAKKLNQVEILWRRIKYQWIPFNACLCFQNFMLVTI